MKEDELIDFYMGNLEIGSKILKFSKKKVYYISL